jgi:flagellar biosynthesis component FlhA
MEPENKYHQAKIYKITDINYTKMYIGSTTQPLCKRFADHKKTYIRNQYKSSSSIIFQEFGIENVKIELIAEVKCENKDQLLQIEGKHIRENKCVNKNVAGRTQKEYDQLPERKQKRKEYREKNKEKEEAKNKEIYVCECGMTFTRGSLCRHLKRSIHTKLMEQKQQFYSNPL